MAFQSVVNRYRARGVAGQAATPDQSIYTAKNYLSDGTVKVGAFAYAKAGTDNTATVSGSGTVLGLVERVITFPIYDVREEASVTVPKGYGVTIAVRGDYYVETTATATVGDAVFASNTDGTIKTAAAGSTQSGFTETPWRVKDILESGSSGGLILVSDWNTHTVSPSGGSVDTSNLMNKDFSNASGSLAITNGGTGATTAEQARTNLGITQ